MKPLCPSQFTKWLLGLIGMKLDVLDGRPPCTRTSLSASNRTIKISASIATTLGSKRPNSDLIALDLFSLKTVTGSTTFAHP